jgi:plasmid replication initiation protein
MSSVKVLKCDCKKRMLKGYSTMKKGELEELIKLDIEGKAPEKHMTNKRKKALIKEDKAKATAKATEDTNHPA